MLPIWRNKDLLLVATGHVDGVQRRPRAGVAEEHQHATVRSPGRAFIVEARGQQAFARTVSFHHTNGELALRLLGEGDEITAW